MDLDITVVTDVVCPWCLIGGKRLDDALAQRPDVHARIVHRPYLLDPTLPPEGVDLRERLAKKYGAEPARLFGRVEAAARASGIALDFARIERMPSTLAAHTLVRHVPEGEQHAVAKALFAAYFLEGRDVSSPDVLAEIGAAHGLDAAEARRIVTGEDALRETREEADAQRRSGIDGVPFFLFDGRFAVTGAQEVATFVRVIDTVLARRAEAHA